MSDQPGNNGGREPLSKQQNCVEEAAESIAFGGPMYDEATARKMLQEAVLVSAEDAFDGQAVIGFDPDDAALDNMYFVIDTNFHSGKETTPMTDFALKGDAKMCRYLVSRGASTTKASEQDNPLYAMYAAARGGHLDVCKVLYANGAQNDVRRDDHQDGSTPFHFAAIKDHDEVLRWLTLHGALCADGSSETVEGHRIYPKYLRRSEERDTISEAWTRARKGVMSSSCKRLVWWAIEVTQTHSALVTFLLGTLPPAPDVDQDCILQCLSGHAGVRKHIGDLVGLEVTKRKHLRILHQVVDVLPSFVETDDVSTSSS